MVGQYFHFPKRLHDYLLLFTEIGFAPGGSSPEPSTHKDDVATLYNNNNTMQ
jgi:hypothetical protein